MSQLPAADPPRPLVVTADERRLDEVLRLCAAADVVPVVAGDAATARRSWSSASAVVVDAALAEQVAVTVAERRRGVHLLVDDRDDTAGWALALRLGAEAVHALPVDERRLTDALGAPGRPGPGAAADGGDGVVVAVVGGSGGAGATTLASAVAVAAARDGTSTLLVDADPLGGGVDLAVGAEDADGVRWPDLVGTRGRVAGESLRDVLPRESGLGILSWDRGDVVDLPAEAVRSVLAAGRDAHALTVVDLPRHLGDVAEEVLLVARLTVLVAVADVRGIAAATRVLTSLRDHASDVGVVVRAPATGPGIDPELVADTLALPLLADWRADRRVAAAVDDGLGPLTHRRAPTSRVAAALVDLVVHASRR